MSGITGITPQPLAPTHDPLGRAMTEEQKARLQEQATPPIEETPARERLGDRRREGAPKREHRPPDDDGPGRIIDSYA